MPLTFEVITIGTSTHAREKQKEFELFSESNWGRISCCPAGGPAGQEEACPSAGWDGSKRKGSLICATTWTLSGAARSSTPTRATGRGGTRARWDSQWTC